MYIKIKMWSMGLQNIHRKQVTDIILRGSEEGILNLFFF